MIFITLNKTLFLLQNEKIGSAELKDLNQLLVIRPFSFWGLHYCRHVFHPTNMAFEQLLESQRASHLNCLLFACPKPRYLQLQQQEGKVAKGLEVILAALGECSELVVAGKRAPIVDVSNF